MVFKVLGPLLIVFFVFVSLYAGGLLRFNYPSHTEFPIWGLDVSHHQGDIDWGQVASERFQFVYIKATEGGDFKDKKFKENWREARAVKLHVGAYHFFTLCRSGYDQAKNFTETVPKNSDSLPPAIDLEFVGNCSKRPTQESFHEDLRVFIREISDFYNATPIIYTTYEFYQTYLQDTEFQSYSYWIRDVYGRPDKKMPNWVIWQFADNAYSSGIETKVDLNVVNPVKNMF